MNEIDSSLLQPQKKIVIVLKGGIGNQLFQYFAGKYLQNIHNARLVIDATLVQNGRTGHHEWISSFVLPEKTLVHAGKFNLHYLGRHFAKKVGLDSLLRKPRSLLGSTNYLSPTAGFDPSLAGLDFRKSVTVEGYFQTFAYFETERKRSEQALLQLASPSPWFIEMLARLQNEKPLLWHVRRGDYRLHAESFGLLSLDYYINASKRISQTGSKWDRIWIFTDNAELVSAEFEDRIPYPFEVITTPLGNHAAETLVLMATARLLVIGNSTFSLWAGLMGQHDLVVAPSIWFRAKPEPEKLLPSNWIREESTWL